MKPDNFNMEDSHQQIEFGNNTAVFISVRFWQKSDEKVFPSDVLL